MSSYAELGITVGADRGGGGGSEPIVLPANVLEALRAALHASPVGKVIALHGPVFQAWARADGSGEHIAKACRAAFCRAEGGDGSFHWISGGTAVADATAEGGYRALRARSDGDAPRFPAIVKADTVTRKAGVFDGLLKAGAVDGTGKFLVEPQAVPLLRQTPQAAEPQAAQPQAPAAA